MKGDIINVKVNHKDKLISFNKKGEMFEMPFGSE